MEHLSSSTASSASSSDEPPGTDGSTLLGQLRAVLTRYCRRLRSGRAETEPTTRSTAERTDPTATLDTERVPERVDPLTDPARDPSGGDSPDIVGIETAAGLRLSVPEHPESTIVSDKWVPVER